MLSKKQTEQRNAILECLYLHGPLSRAELSRLLGITPATMTEVTGVLIHDGILREFGEESNSSGMGRKKILLEVSPKIVFYMGVELSERKMTICLTDNVGICEAKETVVQEFDKNTPLSEKNVGTVILNFLESHPQYNIQAIGLAIPGHYDKKANKIVSNNPLWTDFAIDQLASSLPLPVFIKNNVKCMALAKLYLDTQKNQFNFLFLNLKRGIFAAYVYDGKIYGDNNYLVGEVGHIVVDPDGEQCECGKAGCLQTYASMSWILKKARYAYEGGASSYLPLLVKESSDLTMEHVLLAYNMGDELIHRIIEQAIDYLALQIDNLTMILDVNAVFIHGKLFEESLIAEKLHSKLENSPLIVQQERQIERTILSYDSKRGALGACALAIQKHFIYQIS